MGMTKQEEGRLTRNGSAADWPNRHIELDQGEFVAYDEAGLEAARNALIRHAATLEGNPV